MRKDNYVVLITVALIWLPVFAAAVGFTIIELNTVNCANRGIDQGYTVEEIKQICGYDLEEK